MKEKKKKKISLKLTASTLQKEWKHKPHTKKKKKKNYLHNTYKTKYFLKELVTKLFKVLLEVTNK